MYNRLFKRSKWLLAILTATCLLAAAASSAAQDAGIPNSSLHSSSNSSPHNSGSQKAVSFNDSIFNGTTYLLGEKEAQVIVPVNASLLNFTLSDKALNMTVLDGRGRPVEFNSSYRYWRGEHIYSLNLSGHVRGSLIYTMPLMGQQFILPIREKVQVRIVLPLGYTTGERSLGIARPEPDEVVEGGNETSLTWYNTTLIPYIELNYYRRSAPRALGVIFSILGLAAIVLLVQYYLSMRRLKRSAEDLDGEIKK